MKFIFALLALAIAQILATPIFGSEPAGSKPAPRKCPMLLSAVPIEDYLRVVRKTELTPQVLKAAEERLIWHFTQLPFLTDASMAAHPELKVRIQTLFISFNAGVSALVRGFDGIADGYAELLQAGFRRVGITTCTLDIAKQAIKKAAEDNKIYPAFSMAEFILRGEPSVEVLLLKIVDQVPGLKDIEFPGAIFIEKALVPIIAGPRQAEMVRTALQYSMTRPGDRVLEIGYGTPAVLLAFSYFTRTRLMGVDPLDIPVRANEVLRPMGIELVQGLFPDSSEALVKIRSQGPYTVIMALDTLKKENGVLETSVPPLNYVKQLYDLLDEGGVLILINDFEGEPYFTRDQAKAVGFNIVRWGVQRPISPSLMPLMPYDGRNPKAGSLSAFVLRRGSIREERVMMTGVKMK